MADWARLTAAGFGSGWLPKAPGTWGSLAALLPGWLLLAYLGVAGLAAGVVLIALLGAFVCARLLPVLDEEDPAWVVIDEWAGQWLALLICAVLLGQSLWAVPISFALFRFFDIAKPWPIRAMEEMGPPWWAIMADDLVAGLFAGIVAAAFIIVRGIF